MSDEKFKGYIIDLVVLVKEKALQAKFDADQPKEGHADYNTGYLMALHEVISLMKNQTMAFDIELEDIGLADIDPESDLL